jgi:hypothetical protein
MAPLLDGVRGEAPLDVPALCALAARVGDLVHHAHGKIRSVDLNPVMLGESGAVVVDALMEVAS